MKNENLRVKVIEKGQDTRDRRKIEEVLRDLDLNLEFNRILDRDLNFSIQASRDIRAQYKFYDALGMWLGQNSFWTEETKSFLLKIASAYLDKDGK